MEKSGPDMENVMGEIKPDTETGSQPLKPEEFETTEPVIVSSEEDLTRLERESESVSAPEEVKPVGEEVGAAVEQAAQEVSETAEALESVLSETEDQPQKPAPEEGSWD
ncbi:MAG: hypothetical protein U9Q03_01795 [Patescibacteria group bacterium]|nr:hypothetical protein [Patescibacteria group bacterium]